MIKIIQFIKDPHVVFLNADEPDIDIAKYRVLMVDEHDGTILMVSAMDCDLDGSTTVDDLFHHSSSEIKDIVVSKDKELFAFLSDKVDEHYKKV